MFFFIFQWCSLAMSIIFRSFPTEVANAKKNIIKNAFRLDKCCSLELRYKKAPVRRFNRFRSKILRWKSFDWNFAAVQAFCGKIKFIGKIRPQTLTEWLNFADFGELAVIENRKVYFELCLIPEGRKFPLQRS